MTAQIVDGLKSRSASVATFVNANLAQLQTHAGLEIGLVGYRTDASGSPFVGSRWAGPLAGSEFVPADRLGGSELRIENRTRKLPSGGSEEVSFPIWYDPTTEGQAPRKAAFEHAARILTDQVAKAHPGTMPPLVLHICTDVSSDGSPLEAVRSIQALTTNLGSSLVFHLQLALGSGVPAACYLATRAHIPQGLGRDLFDAASILTLPFVNALKEAKVMVNSGARGVVCHARPLDLQRFLSLLKAYAGAGSMIGKTPPSPGPNAPPPVPVASSAVRATVRPPGKSTPPAASPAVGKPAEPVRPAAPAHPSVTNPTWPAQPTAAASAPGTAPAYALADETVVPSAVIESVPTPISEPSLSMTPSMGASSNEPRRAVVLVLDRTVTDADAPDAHNVWMRLQERGNEILSQLAKSAGAACEVAMIVYGGDVAGQVDLRSEFEGPLAGRVFVNGEEIGTGALRTEEYEEQLSNGVGGLITLSRKKQIFLDHPPAASCSCRPAFEEVCRLLREWIQNTPQAVRPAIVLHLTRGKHDADDLDFAAAAVRGLEPGTESAVLYHLVLTEQPMKSFAYPDRSSDFGDLGIAKLWEASSLLLGREALKESRPFLSDESRGIVINGKFDLLWPEGAV